MLPRGVILSPAENGRREGLKRERVFFDNLHFMDHNNAHTGLVCRRWGRGVSVGGMARHAPDGLIYSLTLRKAKLDIEDFSLVGSSVTPQYPP